MNEIKTTDLSWAVSEVVLILPNYGKYENYIGTNFSSICDTGGMIAAFSK